MAYSIKQVAAMLGITPQTLRFYERYGIEAGSRGEENGYRSYSHVGVDELMSIRKYRNCGFTLAEAAKMMKRADAQEVSGLLLRQSEAIEREIEINQLKARKLKEVSEEVLAHDRGPQHVQTPPLLCRHMVNEERTPGKESLRALSVWGQWMPMAQWTLFFSRDLKTRFYGFIMEEESARICGVEPDGSCFRSDSQVCIREHIMWPASEENEFDRFLPEIRTMQEKYGPAAAAIRVQKLLNHRKEDKIICHWLIFYPIA